MPNQFTWRVAGALVPADYARAVDAGVRAALEHGVLAGYPCSGVDVIAIGGVCAAQPIPGAVFQGLGSEATTNALQQAGPYLLEPMLAATILAPDEFVGDLLGDLHTRRAHVRAIDRTNHLDERRILATIPEAELLRYAKDLAQITNERASFTTTFSHYAPVPRRGEGPPPEEGLAPSPY